MLTISPKTRFGKISFYLALAFIALVVFANLTVNLQGPRDNQTFFDNLPLSLTMLSGMICAIGSFFTGAFSIVKLRERAVFAFVSSLIGLLMLFFIVGELIVAH